jgi:ligand-binding sensor domain-containing protein
MIRITSFLLLAIVSSLPALAAEPSQFPAGTARFFDTYPAAAVAAEGGGVWLALPEGIVRYTAAGAGTVLTTPGGAPKSLALAADGTIWFVNASGIGRLATTGVLLERYNFAPVGKIVVASDNSLWYTRLDRTIIGRIARGDRMEWPAPADTWSLAPASNGAIWILPHGMGTTVDSILQMSANGTITVSSLDTDVLYGTLQTLPDSTLYISTGIRHRLLRMKPGSPLVETISAFDASEFLIDGKHNIWSVADSDLKYLAGNGTLAFITSLPNDPRGRFCSNVPAWTYAPLAIDSSGGLWLQVYNQAMYISLALPCPLPTPDAMPTLIRIDATALIARNQPSTARRRACCSASTRPAP